MPRRKVSEKTIYPRDLILFCFELLLNKLDRFHLAGNAIDLAGNAIDRLPVSGTKSARFQQFIQNKLREHKRYTETHGEDLPEIRDWKWTLKEGPVSGLDKR